MRVPDMITLSAVFLCVKKDGEIKPAGTGFVLSVESDAPTDNRHMYLVTARHCIEGAKRFGPLYVRLNTLRGDDVQLIELKAKWEYHEDLNNDVAVTPFPGPPFYQMMPFERESLATPDLIKEKSIGIGEELLVVGLFALHHGRKMNLPIIRSGMIAAMPWEAVLDAETGGEYEAFLAEIRSIGGLSGSPVWVAVDPGRPIPAADSYRSDRWSFYLLGLVRGHWQKNQAWLSDFEQTEQESLNTGIAIVTPIHKALEIIDSEVFVKQRAVEDRKRAEQHAGEQVLGSAIPEPASDDEFERFEDLTRKLAQTPKPKN
jgi:hypothetical protein